MLNSDFTIVPAGEEHLAGMILLLEELFSLETDFYSDPAKQKKGLKALLDDDRAVLSAAVSGRSVIGMASLQTLISTAEGGPVGLVEDVVVKQEFRGRGVGKALLLFLEKNAREKGLTRLQLLADRKNKPAISFYKACGWIGTDLINIRKCI